MSARIYYFFRVSKIKYSIQYKIFTNSVTIEETSFQLFGGLYIQNFLNNSLVENVGGWVGGRNNL